MTADTTLVHSTHPHYGDVPDPDSSLPRVRAMPDPTTRLALTVLAMALPGPWTPVIVPGYAMARRHDHAAAPPPSACAPVAVTTIHPHHSRTDKPEPYPPARNRR